MFKPQRRAADPRWELAASTQVFVSTRETVVRLVREVHAEAGERVLDGVLIARRHPTGWFLSALRCDDVPAHDRDHFRELVTVRSYLLLRDGPEPRLWGVAHVGHEWRSAATSLVVDLADLVRDPGA